MKFREVNDKGKKTFYAGENADLDANIHEVGIAARNFLERDIENGGDFTKILLLAIFSPIWVPVVCLMLILKGFLFAVSLPFKGLLALNESGRMVKLWALVLLLTAVLSGFFYANYSDVVGETLQAYQENLANKLLLYLKSRRETVQAPLQAYEVELRDWEKVVQNRHSMLSIPQQFDELITKLTKEKECEVNSRLIYSETGLMSSYRNIFDQKGNEEDVYRLVVFRNMLYTSASKICADYSDDPIIYNLRRYLDARISYEELKATPPK